MKRELARKILIAITTIIALIFICAPPLARRSQIHENATLIRYTQLLLSRKGFFYTGPIDGECNIQTQEAIEKYKGLPPATPSDKFCRIQLLEDLNGKLTASSEFHDIVSQNITAERNLASIQAEIDKLKSDLSNTITTINKINGGMSTHFITLSSSMATIGITALLAGISLIVAILIASINIFIPIFVKKTIEDVKKTIE